MRMRVVGLSGLNRVSRFVPPVRTGGTALRLAFGLVGFDRRGFIEEI